LAMILQRPFSEIFSSTLTRAISSVPPPKSMTRTNLGSSIRSPYPITAATGSSITLNRLIPKCDAIILSCALYGSELSTAFLYKVRLTTDPR